MMKSSYLLLPPLIMLLAASCRKPYNPTAISNAASYLVVEGIINTAGNDSTSIKLSRTVPLNSGLGTLPEDNAVVTIQDDNNQSYSLTETRPGIYTSVALNLSNSHKYRLSINTADGKTYLSDYVSPMVTPQIDSIGFTVKSNGMQVYVNTHDPNNSTHYYRWDYTETWMFHAKYYSAYIANGDSDVVLRTPAQFIYQCWGNDISTDIILGSSAKLTQDVIYQGPIIFVPSTSEKIETRYSILLKQYALTSDGYNYFEQLKKNTEELGSIFDAQPSQLTGNIHCTSNAATIAIGYVTAGTVQQKRVFIDNTQVPNNWVPTYPYDCEQDTALYNDPKNGGKNEVLLFIAQPGATGLATQPIGSSDPSVKPIGFLFTGPDCADCSIRGTLIKPSFWQ